MSGKVYLQSPTANLALARLAHGLTRRLGGWYCDGPGFDRADLLNVRTVQALARLGLAEISADGRHAKPAKGETR